MRGRVNRCRGQTTLRVLAYTLCLSLVPLFSTGNVQAQATEEEARAHFQLGRAAYDRGDFAKASGEFEEAYRISKRAGLLYNLYLAYRDANEQAKAADALRRFLTEEKDIENRSQLEARLAALEKGLAQQSAAQTEPGPSQPAPAAAPATPASEPAASAPAPAAYSETQSSEQSGKPKLVPLILMGAGGALIIGSIVTGVMTLSAQSDLEHACPTKANCDPGLQSTKNRGQTLAIVTDVLMVAGVAAAATGATLFFVWRGSQKSDAPTASLMCLPGACAGNVRVKF